MWPQVGEDIQQSDSSEGTQAQTSSYHKVATIESLPDSGRLAGPVSTPTAREGWGVKKSVAHGPPRVTQKSHMAAGQPRELSIITRSNNPGIGTL